MNALIKTMIFSALRARYPNFQDILIDVRKKKALIKFSATNIKEEMTGETEEKNFKMLAESKGLTYIDTIYISQERNTIVIKGDKNIVI